MVTAWGTASSGGSQKKKQRTKKRKKSGGLTGGGYTEENGFLGAKKRKTVLGEGEKDVTGTGGTGPIGCGSPPQWGVGKKKKEIGRGGNTFL